MDLKHQNTFKTLKKDFIIFGNQFLGNINYF